MSRDGHGSDSVADPNKAVKSILGGTTRHVRLPAETHMCPGWRCEVQVPNSRFCCLDHWAALSVATRRAIARTARLSLLSAPRRAAIELAMAEFRDLR